MGQKIHPEGFRVGYIHDWKSNWFNEKEFADYLNEDLEIRSHIENKLSHAGLSKITIKKGSGEVEVDISTARPGIVIGKSGTEVDALRRELHKLTGKPVKVNIKEIKRPEIEAKTTTGRIGVKCWINKGEVMPEGFRSDRTDEDGGPQSGGGRGGRS